MQRLLRMSLLFLLLAIPAFTRTAALPARAQDATATSAAHPLVGAWVFDLDVDSQGDPPLYLLFHADGTWLIANPYYGDGVGSWQATGGHTADATAVFQDLDPDPNLVVMGSIAATFAITVDESENAFVGRWTSEKSWLDGTVSARDDGIGRAARLESAPLAATPVASEVGSTASQPEPPATGPGSDDTPFPAARATKYGPDPGGYWIWEPATSGGAVAPGPFPVVLYVDGCCTGDYPNLRADAPLPMHLAQRGYVVIGPVYRDTTVLDDVPARLRDALAELERPGHAVIDPARFAAVGYSFGGVPALTYAATAAAAGLPVPQALLVLAPCVDGALAVGADPASTCRPLPENAAFPAGMKAIVLAFGEDFRVGIDMPRAVFGVLASLPAADRDFVVMASDGHGAPPVEALHETPSDGVDTADRYGVWKLADALFACAIDGNWCQYALGNTPEQRSMGIWSDGTPVTELQVANDAAS